MKDYVEFKKSLPGEREFNFSYGYKISGYPGIFLFDHEGRKGDRYFYAKIFSHSVTSGITDAPKRFNAAKVFKRKTENELRKFIPGLKLQRNKNGEIKDFGSVLTQVLASSDKFENLYFCFRGNCGSLSALDRDGTVFSGSVNNFFEDNPSVGIEDYQDLVECFIQCFENFEIVSSEESSRLRKIFDRIPDVGY